MTEEPSTGSRDATATASTPLARVEASSTRRRLTRRQRAAARVIAAVAAPVVVALGATLRWRVTGLEHLERLASAGHQPVMAFWHGRILGATYYFRRRGIVVMISENFDGEWIARTIEKLGYRTARGSSSRGGRRALLQLRRAVAGGSPVGFALDGPRGPARRAQPGAVWLASATGHPVLPFHLEAARHWTVPSWDRTQIPQPFTRMALAIGPPIFVPAGADSPRIAAEQRALEAALEGLAAQTATLLDTQASTD